MASYPTRVDPTDSPETEAQQELVATDLQSCAMSAGSQLSSATTAVVSPASASLLSLTTLGLNYHESWSMWVL